MASAPNTGKSDTLPRFEGWVTIEKLGEGGMCEVYRVRPEAGDGPERAIKVLMDRSDVSIRRFTDEGVLIQRIVHPNIVRVHHIADQARPPWLVMDLLAGRDLEETIEVEGAMDPERAAPIFADLANALAAVHAAGVRHRDIKPANLRLGTDGVPRLIDFGIARDATAERHTKQGFVVGTASYLPPEIFTEDDSHRVQDTEVADVYALGQTLSEVLAGRVTHGHREDGTEASLLVRIMRDKMEREYLDPRDKGAHVPEELAAIVRRATARDPAERTPTARTLERELRGWLQGRTSFGSTAPVSRVELRPGREPSPTVGGPTLPPPSGPPSIAPLVVHAPAPRRSRFALFGALGAMGMAGAGVLVVGLVVLAVAGVVSLWVWRPQASPAEVGVIEAVGALNTELAGCRAGPGEMAVVLTVRAGHAQQVDIARSTVDRRTEKCVTRVLTKARYPDGAAVTVEVPVVFRQEATMPLVADYGTPVPKVPLAFAITALVVGVGVSWAGFVGFGLLMFGVAGVFGASAASALYSHRLGRNRIWAEVLNGVALRGDERVLDVGCGRGAVLVALARRLPRGKAVGFHPWTPADTEAPTRTNVVAEGMTDRVTLQPGDLRSMPFLDRTFPLVVSHLALCELPDSAGRAQAVCEMWRVLADGGTLLIVDRWYGPDHARTLEMLGATAVIRRDLGWRLWAGGPHRGASLVQARRP